MTDKPLFIVNKWSTPGWEFRTDHIEWVRWILEENICSMCKQTEAEFKANAEEQDWDDNLEEGINPYTFAEFFPEHAIYKQLSDREKIELLLDTACGCEFGLEEPDDEST